MFQQPEGSSSNSACGCGKSVCDCKTECSKPGKICCGDDRTCDKSKRCQGGPCTHDSKTGTV